MKEEVKHCFVWMAEKLIDECQNEKCDDCNCREKTDELFKIFYNILKKHIDLTKLTKEEALELRFYKWNEVKDLYLLPLYLLPLLENGTEVCSIFGEKFIYDKDKCNKDHRKGCVSFGLIIND